MKIWKIGTKWGNQDLIPIFRKHQIAFAGSEAQELINCVSSGDLVCITKGTSIEAVVRVTGIDDLQNIDILYLIICLIIKILRIRT